MAGDTVITVIGNLTADAELRFTPSGAAVANFTVASTPRQFDRQSNEWKDGDTLFMRCSIWRQAAENVAESLTKGMRVIVTGRLKQRSYEKDGETRTVVEMEVDEVGPSLRNATAKVQKAERQQGQQQGQPQGGQDPWASQAQASQAQAQQAQQPAPWGQQQQAQQPAWSAPQGQPQQPVAAPPQQQGGWGPGYDQPPF